MQRNQNSQHDVEPLIIDTQLLDIALSRNVDKITQVIIPFVIRQHTYIFIG